MSRVPRIRFKGFEEDWEQRKLVEVAIFSKGVGYSKSDLKDSGIPIILYGRLYTNYEIVIEDVDTFVDGIFGAVYSKGGEIITPSSGETSEDISIASVVKKSGILLGGDLNIIYPQSFLNPIFIAVSISNGKPHKEMAKRAQGKSVVHLHNVDLSKIEIDYPSIDEQTRISSYFITLDHLITLHQRKLEKLKIIKKSLLENLFPQNGEKTPKIRFSGFTEDWEQRKVGAICSISTGKSNTQDRVEDGKYPFYVRSSIVERSNRYLFDEEAVLTVGDGVGTGKVFHYVDGKYDLHQRVYRMFDFEKDISAKYFFYYFSNNFYDRVMAMTAKTSVDSVRYEVISDMDIIVPHIKEQKFIADIFQNFDHLITLHQSKLDKLQKIKKSMLESMFV